MNRSLTLWRKPFVFEPMTTFEIFPISSCLSCEGCYNKEVRKHQQCNTPNREVVRKMQDLTIKGVKVNCAVGYVRLSSKAAKEDSVSIERQKAEVISWCNRNGFNLTNIYTDTKVSGRKVNRIGLDAAIGEAAMRGCALVAYSLDRLIRDHDVLRRLKDERITFRLLDMPETNELVIDTLVGVAKAYSQQISDKMRKYHQHRKEQVLAGLATPHPTPLPNPKPEQYQPALKAARAKRTKKADTFNAHAWRFIEPMAQQGKSTRGICEELNIKGFQTSTGNPWTNVAVFRIIQKFKPAS